jgi:hypothetical protein
LEKFRFSAVYCCKDCTLVMPVSRWSGWISKFARCPRCGQFELQKLSRQDPIEGMVRGPFRLLQRLLGAPLLYCGFCRLQFYDLRTRRKREKSKACAA